MLLNYFWIEIFQKYTRHLVSLNKFFQIRRNLEFGIIIKYIVFVDKIHHLFYLS